MAFSMTMGAMDQVFVDGKTVEEAPRILRQDQLMLPHLYAPLKGTASCHECTKAFTTFRRKYNCQMCGEVVCRNCTVPYVAEVANDVIDAKVCLSCVAVVEAEYQETIAATSPRSTIPHVRSTHLSSSSRISDDLIGDNRRRTESLDRLSSIASSSSPDAVSLVTESTTFDYVLDFNWGNPWPKPPVVENDAQRIQVLRSYNIPDKEPNFDAICEFACKVLQCPVAVVSVIDDKYQRFKASIGLAQEKIPRGVAFCAHALVSKEPIVVLDTSADARFQNNPMVKGAGILFYASAPICAPSGHVLGTVCVMDQKPRTQVDASMLEVLANVVVKKLEDSERLPMRRSSTTNGRRSSSSSTRGHRTSSSESGMEQERVSSSSSAVPLRSTEANSYGSQEGSQHEHSRHQHMPFALSGDDLLPRSQWVSDSKRTNCHVCAQKFSMFLRKHHCRLCGEVICKNCAMSTMLVKSNEASVADPKKLVRVAACLQCLTAKASTNIANLNVTDNFAPMSSSMPPQPISVERPKTLERSASHSHMRNLVPPTHHGTSAAAAGVPLLERTYNDEPEPEVIPVLQRNQSYDVDSHLTMYNNTQLVLDPPANVMPTRDFSKNEIQSMLVRLLSQSNDIQQQLSQVAPPDQLSLSR
ncbi:Aste57867_21143 [Aphanomyces stellatus]|uniref:Aste57867_21143 protein n=1 Tax=Aphanomyces stellatus TaxID=120398 RepID=A0A485LHG3_9STRA|nr:hypothetical protein As57867_021075 [Aphanomyces stellatus]VFT97817.1 Aste57867_21143 [Aphanomyces stellatus]